jgi:nicotinate-nucleotide adenylyltransferase
MLVARGRSTLRPLTLDSEVCGAMTAGTGDRIGVLGGSFDPIHYGHLAIAEEARAALRLDQVLLIPAGHQPLKAGNHAALPEQRLAMARLACAPNPSLAVSDMEIARSGPSYTVVTLEELAAQRRGELFFILGVDALADFQRWRAADRILELATIIGMRRAGSSPDLAPLRAAIPAIDARLVLLDGPLLAISSSDLRQRVAEGRPIRYLTPDPVVAYIAEQGLYR